MKLNKILKNNLGIAHLAILIVISLTAIGFVGYTSWNAWQANEKQYDKTNSLYKDRVIPQGWVKYTNPDLGINFYHPRTWKDDSANKRTDKLDLRFADSLTTSQTIDIFKTNPAEVWYSANAPLRCQKTTTGWELKTSPEIQADDFQCASATKKNFSGIAGNTFEGGALSNVMYFVAIELKGAYYVFGDYFTYDDLNTTDSQITSQTKTMQDKLNNLVAEFSKTNK